MKDFEGEIIGKRRILRDINEQTDIEYLSGLEYGLKMGGNIKESEIKGYRNYIIKRIRELNNYNPESHFVHDA